MYWSIGIGLIIIYLYETRAFNGKLEVSKIDFKDVGSAGKCLTSKSSLKNGETILSIPDSVCLFCHRSGAIRGLQGQTELTMKNCGDLRESVKDEDILRGRTWDVQLSLALLDATSFSKSAAPLWERYTLLMPPAETVTLPFCMSLNSLTALQNEAIIDGALKQKQRLNDLFPGLSDPKAHPITSMAMQRTFEELSKFSFIDLEKIDKLVHELVPTPLEWAFAMVRSRCFQFDEDNFAVVPVLDMANHVQESPSARYLWLNGNDNEKVETEGFFTLIAEKDLNPGEEITISYNKGYSNDRLLVQYGFHIEGNEYDQLFRSMELTNEKDEEKMLGNDFCNLLLASALSLNMRSEGKDRNRNMAAAKSLCRYSLEKYESRFTKENKETDANNEWLDVLKDLNKDLKNLENSWKTSLEDDLSHVENVKDYLLKTETSIIFISYEIGEDEKFTPVVKEPKVLAKNKDLSGVEIVNAYQYRESLLSRIERKKLLKQSIKILELKYWNWLKKNYLVLYSKINQMLF